MKDPLTKFIFWAMFELFVSHELLDLARHSLNVVDDEFIEIGELLVSIHNELGTHGLAGRIRVRLDDI